MRISIPLAAAIAAVVVLASVSPSAEAQSGSMSGPMMSYSPSKATKAPPRRAARGYLPRAAGRKGPGGCGTYMYWKGGKCHDARLPSKK